MCMRIQIKQTFMLNGNEKTIVVIPLGWAQV